MIAGDRLAPFNPRYVVKSLDKGSNLGPIEIQRYARARYIKEKIQEEEPEIEIHCVFKKGD